MRIRAVKPDFWSDEILALLPDPVRLFYIGLWGMADDAGWFEYRPSQIGATLYPYRSTSKREKDIDKWMTVLTDNHRVKLYPCGCGYIPTLSRHQTLGGRPNYTLQARHGKHRSTDMAVHVRAGTTAEAGREGDSYGRGGVGGISEFSAKVPRPGVKEN